MTFTATCTAWAVVIFVHLSSFYLLCTEMSSVLLTLLVVCLACKVSPRVESGNHRLTQLNLEMADRMVVYVCNFKQKVLQKSSNFMLWVCYEPCNVKTIYTLPSSPHVMYIQLSGHVCTCHQWYSSIFDCDITSTELNNKREIFATDDCRMLIAVCRICTQSRWHLSSAGMFTVRNAGSGHWSVIHFNNNNNNNRFV